MMKMTRVRRYTPHFTMALKACSPPSEESRELATRILNEMDEENAGRNSYTYHLLILLHIGLNDYAKVGELIRDMDF